MKSRTFYSAAVLLAALAAQAAELVTFDEVRGQYQSYKDPTRLSYLYNRCAALQLNVSALFARKGQGKSAQNSEALAHHYMVLSEANEREIDKKSGLKSKDTMKTVHRNVATLSETYSKLFKSNFAKRGDYILGDVQLEAELAECNSPEAFKKKALTD